MNIVEKELDDQAAAFFLNELEDGGALSEVLWARLLSAKVGRLSVLLPEDARGDIMSFRAGGKLPSGAVRPVVGGYAVQVLNTNDALAAIFAGLSGVATFAFEAVSLERADVGRPRLSNDRLAVLGETVVFLRDAATSAPGDLVHCMKRASSGWYRLAVASSAGKSEWLRSRQEWTRDDANSLVDAALCIALGVYDGESSLLWRPGKVSMTPSRAALLRR